MNDLRFAVRQLLKNPVFTLVAMFTLALGVAGNIVIFSIFNAFYLRPFPFAEPSRLVDLNETAPRWNLKYTGLAYREFNGWRENNRSFKGMAAWTYLSCNASSAGGVDWIRGARVTHDLASLLRIRPVLGRSFTAEEDRLGGAKVVMLGYGFWQRQFGGKQDVIGQTLRLNDQPFSIVGVLPRDETLLVEGDFWVPLAFDPRAQQGWFLSGVGRLRDGVSLGRAREELLQVHRNLVEAKRANENTAPRLTPLSERFFGAALPVVRLLLGAVGVVLLIACGNVAALMLARGLARTRELSLRRSLGATPWQLSRLIGLESLLLSVLGGLAGLALGRWGLHTLLRFTEQPPRWVRFDLDWRVGVFAGLMVVGCALLGALPVIRSALTADLHCALQSSASQSTTTSAGRRSLHGLVVAEMALTLVLMVQAGLLLEVFHALQRANPGYRPDDVLVYEIALPDNAYGSKEARTAFFQEHLARVRGLPGVVSASAVTAPPLGGHWGNFFTIENAPPSGPNEPDPVVLQRIAFPGYLETMGVAFTAGRDFTEQDGLTEGARAVIVNSIFAQRFWPDQDPIGKRIRHRGSSAPWMTVVGVVRDVQHYGADQPMIPGVYLPYAQDPQGQMSMVVRSAAPAGALVPGIRALVRERDPNLAVFGVTTMRERLAQSLWVRQLTAALFAIFSGVALVMALAGVYGVFSYVVGRRTREIGVRLALGAPPRGVLWLVVREGLRLTALGIGIGLVGALIVASLMRGLLVGVSPFNPFTFAGVAVLLATVALVACAVPARRAARVDPMAALRCE